MRMSIAFITLLFSMIASLGAGSYEDWHKETPDEMFDRIISDCKYMFNVGTVGGSEALEEFDPQN